MYLLIQMCDDKYLELKKPCMEEIEFKMKSSQYLQPQQQHHDGHHSVPSPPANASRGGRRRVTATIPSHPDPE